MLSPTAGGSEVGESKSKGLCELAHVGSFGKRSAVRSSDDFSLSHFHQSEADEVGDVDSVGDMNVDTNGVYLATGHNGSQFNQVVGGFFMIPNTGNPFGPQLRVPFHGDLERHHDTVREERSGLLHQDRIDVVLHRASAASGGEVLEGRSVDRSVGFESSLVNDDFEELEGGIWKPLSGSRSFTPTPEVPSPVDDFSEVLSDSVHDSSFGPSDPISQFHDGEDPWLVCLTHQGTATGGDRQFDPISPTVPFSVQEQVFVPLTLEECVTLLHACPPIEEETLVYAAHPGFVFFLIRLGSSLAIDGERLTETRQGLVVIADQGSWPDQCVVCLKGFCDCEGCEIPKVLDVRAPSEALPESLMLASSVYDQWKVSPLQGMMKVQSFSVTLLVSVVGTSFWKAKTPEAQSVFLVLDPTWTYWFTPQVGLRFAVLHAHLCGVYEGIPVFYVGEEGHSFLVRVWIDEDLRCLELFAGIGGWSAAFPFLDDNCGCVSIENDPARALLLARMRNCPVIPVDSVRPDDLMRDLVVLCDVRDRRWLKLTLAWPFRLLVQSPPCTSFSGGGNQNGTQDEAGELMLHGMGIASVVDAQISCGENVRGLIGHPHWPLILRFAHLLGLRNLQVKLLELSQVVPMKRPRIFYCFFRQRCNFPINEARSLDLPNALWQLTDHFVPELTEEQRRILAIWELLPPALKKVCHRAPERVLEARTYVTFPLPVLMASYMHQFLLPRVMLESKGLYTWLVRFGHKLRYLHPCEAARLFGFGPDFLFSVDLDEDLTALGNSVSPVQVLQILRPIFVQFGILKVFKETPLWEVVALMVCGWKFLGELALRHFGTSLRFVKKEFGLGAQDGPILVRHPGMVWWISARGLFVAGLDVCDRLTKVLALGSRVIHFWCRLFDDVIEVHVEFEPTVLQAANFSVWVSPLLLWKDCLQLLDLKPTVRSLKSIRPDVPVWMVPRYKLHFAVWFREEDEVVLLARGFRKAVQWVPEQNVSFFLRQVFPFPVAIKYSVVREVMTGAWQSGCDEILPGCYQVDFHVSEVLIWPIGKIQVHPLDTVGQVQNYLCERLYGGKSIPMITVGGRSVAPETLILAANCVGALRLRIFPLRGGAMSLAATEEQLRDLLKQHGVGDKDLSSRVSVVVEKLSYELCKKCLESKTPWAALKAEATKHNVRLVTVLERESKSSASSSGSSTRGEDPLVANDPWKQAPGGRGKRTEKMTSNDARSVHLKVDESFFHVQGNAIPVITVDDLMKGASGLVIEQLHLIADRLAVISQRSRTTGPAALVVCGCSMRDLPRDVAAAKCTDLVVCCARMGWASFVSNSVGSDPGR